MTNKNEIYPKVFTWLFVGLLVTFLTGYALSLNLDLVIDLLSGGSYIILIVAEFAVAIFFSLRLSKMSKTTAIICYLLYSFLTGITFSTIFIAFAIESIMLVFVVTAVLFGIFALIGYTTKKDLSSWSTFLLMALLGVVITGVINIFLQIPALEFVITIISILVFLAYTIYDMKKLEMLTNYNPESGPIYGAFQLYLDFINLFLDLLKLLGKANDN